MRPIHATVVLILALVLGPSCTASASELPADMPAAEEYGVVFFDDFTDRSTVGETPHSDPRAKWFRSSFFGFPTTRAGAIRFRDGVIEIQEAGNRGANLITAAPADNRAGWSGQVFRGGAYFEARLAIGPDPRGRPRHWPAFWMMAVEHLAGKGAARWPGQARDFMRFVENDIFEYNPSWQSGAYFATMHEWYGRWQSCAAGRWCHQANDTDGRRMVRMSPASRFRDFHVYGQLWVPATRSSRGYVQNYLDGRPVGVRVEWEAGEPAPPAPPAKLFNTIDRQGMALILSAGEQSMAVDWVRVWQTPAGSIERR